MDYTRCKDVMKGIGLANWQQELLKVAKDSLEIETDVQNCLMITSLKEFEPYIRANYLGSLSVMSDLFTVVFKNQRPASVEESASRITDYRGLEYP